MSFAFEFFTDIMLDACYAYNGFKPRAQRGTRGPCRTVDGVLHGDRFSAVLCGKGGKRSKLARCLCLLFWDLCCRTLHFYLLFLGND